MLKRKSLKARDLKMKKISLRWKIFLVGLMPLFFLLYVTGNSIYENLEKVDELELLQDKMVVIKQASKVVSQTQKERGMSAANLSGSKNASKLITQRQINDAQIKKLRKILSGSSFSSEYKKKTVEFIDNILATRKIVDDKGKVGTVLKSYTSSIYHLLDMQLYVSSLSSDPQISSKLRALRVVEESKESGGKLRANLSAILAKNKPISVKKFGAIINLKSGVVQGLKSKALIKSEESDRIIKKFFSSSEWKTVDSTFSMVLKNSDKGGYYQDSVKFFGVITGALNIIDELITYNKGDLDETIDVLISMSNKSLWTNIVWSCISSIIVLVFIFGVGRQTTNSITAVIQKVRKTASEVAGASDSIAKTSTKLSDVATQQASSIQETVSSIDEVGSMVQRNSESAGNSTQVSSKSNDAAVAGRKKVNAVMTSMKDISRSNEEIESISKMISEISNKTRIINDIVFQTKLLSINASVEAAKAGEHGKGFAVVAEEVGNLAAISGKASLEITELIRNSTEQVGAVVSSTKTKITHGEKVAEECGEALDSILKNVNAMNEITNEIASSSAEQATGVSEVRKAMQQLDQAMHLNTSASQEASVKANELNGNASRLNLAVEELFEIVSGPNRSVKDGVEHSNVFELKQEKGHQESVEHKLVSGSDVQSKSVDERFQEL